MAHLADATDATAAAAAAAAVTAGCLATLQARRNRISGCLTVTAAR